MKAWLEVNLPDSAFEAEIQKRVEEKVLEREHGLIMNMWCAIEGHTKKGSFEAVNQIMHGFCEGRTFKENEEHRAVVEYWKKYTDRVEKEHKERVEEILSYLDKRRVILMNRDNIAQEPERLVELSTLSEVMDYIINSKGKEGK